MVRLPLLLLAKLVQLRHEALEHGASLLAEPLAHLSNSSARFMVLWKSPGCRAQSDALAPARRPSAGGSP